MLRTEAPFDSFKKVGRPERFGQEVDALLTKAVHHITMARDDEFRDTDGFGLMGKCFARAVWQQHVRDEQFDIALMQKP